MDKLLLTTTWVLQIFSSPLDVLATGQGHQKDTDQALTCGSQQELDTRPRSVSPTRISSTLPTSMAPFSLTPVLARQFLMCCPGWDTSRQRRPSSLLSSQAPSLGIRALCWPKRQFEANSEEAICKPSYKVVSDHLMLRPAS